MGKLILSGVLGKASWRRHCLSCNSKDNINLKRVVDGEVGRPF